MKLAALVLGAFLFSVSAAFAQGASCPRCEQRLDLDEAQWSCLLQRLPDIQSTQTETVFFSLSPQVCTAQATRSVVIPNASPNQPPSRIYRLSRAQVECLANRARPRSGRVVFNFQQECGGGPGAAAQPDYYTQARQQQTATPAPARAPAPTAVPPPAPAPASADAPAASPYDAYRRMQRPNGQ